MVLGHGNSCALSLWTQSFNPLRGSDGPRTRSIRRNHSVCLTVSIPYGVRMVLGRRGLGSHLLREVLRFNPLRGSDGPRTARPLGAPGDRRYGVSIPYGVRMVLGPRRFRSPVRRSLRFQSPTGFGWSSDNDFSKWKDATPWHVSIPYGVRMVLGRGFLVTWLLTYPLK